MPTESNQLIAMKMLCAHLEGITPAWKRSPYDLTGKVYRGRRLFGSETPTPYLTILEAPKPDVASETGENLMQKHDWLLYVQGFVEDDKVHPTDPAYMLKAYVELRLSMLVQRGGPEASMPTKPAYPDVYLLRGGNNSFKISDMSIGPGVTRPPEEGFSDKAWFYVPLRIGVSVDLTNTFTSYPGWGDDWGEIWGGEQI